MGKFTLGNGFKKLVDQAGGPVCFAKKHNLHRTPIKEYYNKQRQIQLATLVMVAAVLDMKNGNGTITKKSLVKVATSLVQQDQVKGLTDSLNELFP